MDNLETTLKKLNDEFLGKYVVFDNGKKPSGVFKVKKIIPKFKNDKTLNDIYFMSEFMNAGFSYKHCKLSN